MFTNINQRIVKRRTRKALKIASLIQDDIINQQLDTMDNQIIDNNLSKEESDMIGSFMIVSSIFIDYYFDKLYSFAMFIILMNIVYALKQID
jgi:hypothetical protein